MDSDSKSEKNIKKKMTADRLNYAVIQFFTIASHYSMYISIIAAMKKVIDILKLRCWEKKSPTAISMAAITSKLFVKLQETNLKH